MMKFKSKKVAGLASTKYVNEPTSDDLWSRMRMEDAFHDFAGSSEEINWQDLQKLLKVALRKDSEIQNGIAQTTIHQAEAANTSIPQSQLPEDVVSNLGKMFLEFICMTVCKNAELAEEFSPKQEEVPLMDRQPQDVSHVPLGFCDEVCRSMVAMYDDDFSGKMGLHEFQQLWNDMILWISVFNNHDRDKSNHLSGFELREALGSAGYSVNNHTLNLLMIRFGSEGNLALDHFIMCIVKLKHMIQTFELKDEGKTGKAEFLLEEWVNATIYS